MKKLLIFLWLICCLFALIYVSTAIYVCDYDSTINLKSLGVDYTCKCTHANRYNKIACEPNE